jgi:methylated-DNA-protein-cysteine methyltransferase related protein
MVNAGFNARVYAIVARIPPGRVTTYGAIARSLGSPRAARIVGGALARSDDDALPCHRVVNREGALTGGWGFGHPEVMRSLLRDEGVPFLSEDQVDLTAIFWDPADDTGPDGLGP